MPVPAPIGRWSQAEVVAAQRIEHDADHLPASDQNTGIAVRSRDYLPTNTMEGIGSPRVVGMKA